MMAWDLWGPPCTQESGDSMRPVWQCGDFPVDRVDLLEEDAINETCCIQVMQLLLSKADEEIGELEKYLRSLQSELKWAETEEWSDMFVSALQEKIDYLDISLKSMKSTMQKDDKSCSRISREPADDMYEVLKKLLAGNYGRKDQPNALASCKTRVKANDGAGFESCQDTRNVDRATDMSLEPPGTESIPDSDKSVDSIERNLQDESQQALIMDGMKKKSDTALSTCERVVSGSEPIPSSLAPITGMQDEVTESKLMFDIVLGSTVSSQNSKVKVEVPQCGSQAADSSRLQGQSREGASKVKAAVSTGAAIASHRMAQGASRKRKLQSVVASPTKMTMCSEGNSLKKGEGQLSRRSEADNAGLRKPLTGKILKVILSGRPNPRQPKCFAVADSALKNLPNPASSAGTADAWTGIKCSNSDGESMGSLTDSSCVESQSDERRSSPLAKLDLESLSMVDLKVIAKQRKVIKYRTLRKSLLVERITDSYHDDCIDRVEVSSCIDK